MTKPNQTEDEKKLHLLWELYKLKEQRIKITDLYEKLGFTRIDNATLTIKLVKKYADENNIPIKFVVDKSMIHGFSLWKRGRCKCEICALSGAIKRKFFTFSCKLVSFIAHNYSDLYRNDESSRKKEFYTFIEQNVEKIQKDMEIVL